MEGFKIVWCSGFVGSNEFEVWPVKYYEGVCSLLYMYGFDPTLKSTGCLKTEYYIYYISIVKKNNSIKLATIDVYLIF